MRRETPVFATHATHGKQTKNPKETETSRIAVFTVRQAISSDFTSACQRQVKEVGAWLAIRVTVGYDRPVDGPPVLDHCRSHGFALMTMLSER
jgi:hypothetical protein